MTVVEAIPAGGQVERLSDVVERLRSSGVTFTSSQCTSPDFIGLQGTKGVKSTFDGVQIWPASVEVDLQADAKVEIGELRAPLIEVRLSVGRGRPPTPGVRPPAGDVGTGCPESILAALRS